MRQNGDVNGFDVANEAIDLPINKQSFNRQLESTLPFYSDEAWPELDQTVWSLRQQEDYLRRLHLDRMEQMMSVDKMVGEVIDLAGPNTVIIFTSDNGHYTGEHRLSNKLAPHEESIRVPLYVKSPAGTRRQVDRLVANIDSAPTILEYAGKAWYSVAYNVDGRSLKKLVENASVNSWRRSVLVEFHQPRSNTIPHNAADWRFGLPDYLALRVADDAGGNSANTLYVQYYQDVAEPDSTFSYERYFLTPDPYQTSNMAPGKLPALDRLIRDFYVASGKDCRTQDIRRVP
ncbi:MAG: sulfatase-like hydrolase/transferase [Chloroflexota bacterium]